MPRPLRLPPQRAVAIPLVTHKVIGQAASLPVFLHNHGVSPLEIFLMAISQSPQIRDEQRL
jgi:hypothetical protein